MQSPLGCLVGSLEGHRTWRVSRLRGADSQTGQGGRQLGRWSGTIRGRHSATRETSGSRGRLAEKEGPREVAESRDIFVLPAPEVFIVLYSVCFYFGVEL